MKKIVLLVLMSTLMTFANEKTGKELYAKCAGCHGVNGTVKALGKAEKIAGQDKNSLIQKISDYADGTRNVNGMGALMKGQVYSMNKDEIQKIATYISSFKAEEEFPQSCKRYEEMSKYDYLRKLLRTSNYDFKSWGKKPSETNFWVDTDKDGFLLIRISYDTHGDGTGGMGWLEYDYKTFRLFDIMPNPEKPTELIYNNDWRDVIKTVFSNRDLEFIKFRHKTFLYETATYEAKAKKFLIKGDCAFVINKRVGWRKIYFYHKKWKTSTMMWIKDEN